MFLPICREKTAGVRGWSAREREALPGFGVEAGGERPLLRDREVARLAQQAGDAGSLPVPLPDAGILGQRAGPPVLILRRGAPEGACHDRHAACAIRRLTPLSADADHVP